MPKIIRDRQGNKRCAKCHQYKPLDEFRLNKATKDGHYAYCKVCNREILHSDKEVAARQRLRDTEEHKAKHNQAAKGYYTAHAMEVKARGAVQIATRNGKLTPVSKCACSVCKVSKATHYHHHLGYEENHRLDVVPVCESCHTSIHFPNP